MLILLSPMQALKSGRREIKYRLQLAQVHRHQCQIISLNFKDIWKKHRNQSLEKPMLLVYFFPIKNQSVEVIHKVHLVQLTVKFDLHLNNSSIMGFFYRSLGASLIRYRPIPWRIAGLLAHELAHTLSVVHPSELPYVCADFPALKFCDSSSLPAECTCSSSEYPPEECLMTFSFGRAIDDAPRYTSCDIEMMRYFSSNISCLARVQSIISVIGHIFTFFNLFRKHDRHNNDNNDI